MWEGDVWVAARAARAGADIVQTGFYQPFETELKGVVDPVTQVDRDAERAIRALVATHFPDDGFLGEEEGGTADWRSGRVWIVDPLDGTVNFVRRLPHVAVSVALWEEGRPLVGVIIDVARNDEFVAVNGQGATVNGSPIQVSETDRMEDALVATGFPYDRTRYAASYLKVFEPVMTRTRGIRRLGAAALDLAWVASGRFDAYWEHGGPEGVRPWDVAAGMLLVTEAGGRFSDASGDPFNLESAAFVATNGRLHEELRAIVESTMPDHLR